MMSHTTGGTRRPLFTDPPRARQLGTGSATVAKTEEACDRKSARTASQRLGNREGSHWAWTRRTGTARGRRPRAGERRRAGRPVDKGRRERLGHGGHRGVAVRPGLDGGRRGTGPPLAEEVDGAERQRLGLEAAAPAREVEPVAGAGPRGVQE